MAYLLQPTLLRALSAGVFLTLAATGCTKDPPGPDITDPTGASSAGINATSRPYAEYNTLVWSDEFDATSLDLTKWTYEVKDTWFNNELEATTNRRDNVTLVNGKLNIIALKESYNGKQYTSGRIITKGKMDFGYGRLDVMAKLPKGKGIWPAIWMLGANDSQVNWPACGEIDIMEIQGSRPGVDLTTMHYGNTVATHQQKGTMYQLPSGDDFSSAFHVYSCVRSQDKLEFFVDGVGYYSLTPSSGVSPYPFNNPFYAILNLAVGGDFDGNPDASTTFPQTLQVDYVKFYQYKQ